MSVYRVVLLASLIVVLTGGAAWAAETAPVAEGDVAIKRAGLQTVDWFIIAIYAGSTIGLGWYFGRKQRTTEEYFVGSGNMNPVLVGISLFATLLSTISYLSIPGESLAKGPVGLAGLVAMPFIYMLVAHWLIPVYMKQRVTSAYELLEERLGLGIRLLGATMFLALRLVWMSLLVYAAAKAMTVMIGADYWIIWPDDSDQFIKSMRGPVNWIIQRDESEVHIASVPVIVLITGLVSVIYSSIGGLRAVVITDFMQTILLFGGAVLVIATVTYDFGGFGWFPTRWQANWDTQPFFDIDPRTRVTMVGTVLNAIVWYVATSGGDQTSVQRFMSTRDANAARRAVLSQLLVGILVSITLYLVGFSLLGYFQAHAGSLPEGISVDKAGDKLFPHFIAFHLPPGISGLVVAAMFAAAMSSIDSGVNSITAVVTSDFFDRFGYRPKTEKGQLRAAKLLAFSIGATAVVGSSFMKFIEGNITEVTGKTVNMLTTPIFALFVFALFIPFSRPLGVFIGAIFGTATAAAIGFSGPLVVYLATNHGVDPGWFGVELLTEIDDETGIKVVMTAVRELNPVTGVEELSRRDPVSFQWLGTAALLVNLAIGTAISWLQCKFGRSRPVSPTEKQS